MKKITLIFLSVILSVCAIGLTGCNKKEEVQIYKVYHGTSFILKDNYLSVYKLTDTNAKVLTIPASVDSYAVKSIEPQAFKGAINLQKVIIPHTVESIGGSAFENCLALNTVEIKTLGEGVNLKGLKTIGAYAFAYSGIQNIDLSSVETLQENALYACLSLKSVVTSERLKVVSSYAFSECRQLESVEFSANSMIVGDYAFYNCNNLKSIKFASVNTFGLGVLYGCNNIQSLTIPKMGQGEQGYLGFFFGATAYQQNPNYVPVALKKVVLTGSRYIPQNAFYNCAHVEQIFIDGVSTIYTNALYGCSALTDLTLTYLTDEEGEDRPLAYLFDNVIPQNLSTITLTRATSLCDNAFKDINSITNVNIPLVEKIGKNAFSGTSLSSITAKSGFKVSGSGYTSGEAVEISVENLTVTYCNYYWFI